MGFLRFARHSRPVGELIVGRTRARYYRCSELAFIFQFHRVIIALSLVAVAVRAGILFRCAIKFAVVYVSAAMAEHSAVRTCVSHKFSQFDRAPNQSLQRTAGSR